MNLTEISYDQLKKAIYNAFDGDSKIFSLYDPNVTVSNLLELTEDIYAKIKAYPDAKIFALNEKNEIIGYAALQDGILISFGISPKYRIKRSLKDFWSLIRSQLRGTFYCHLWSRNIRAVKWLRKMGMVIVDSNPLITKLKFK